MTSCLPSSTALATVVPSPAAPGRERSKAATPAAPATSPTSSPISSPSTMASILTKGCGTVPGPPPERIGAVQGLSGCGGGGADGGADVVRGVRGDDRRPRPAGAGRD